jgi:hypothetical protein
LKTCQSQQCPEILNEVFPPIEELDAITKSKLTVKKLKNQIEDEPPVRHVHLNQEINHVVGNEDEIPNDGNDDEKTGDTDIIKLRFKVQISLMKGNRTSTKMNLNKFKLILN